MKQTLLFVYLLLAISSQSQDCSKELLQEKPGAWRAGPAGYIQNVSATDLKKERSVMAGVHKMVSNQYKPKGCVIDYSYVFGKHLPAASNWIADPYHYTMFILPYLCDPNSTDRSKYYTAISTPTSVNITANVIFSLNNLYAANMPDDDFRGYLKLLKRPEKKDGYYFLGEEVVGNSHLENQKVIEYRWLITYNDTLPFSYITRKEYLLIQRKRLEKHIQESPSEKVYSEEYIANIDEYLKRPQSDLNQVAICMRNEEERFEKFVEEGTQGSFIAVKPNLSYYHPKLPKSVPQFFTVVYKIEYGNPVFEGNIASIQKAVDFAALKNMLGK